MNMKLTAMALALMLGISGAALAKHKCEDCKNNERGGYLGGVGEVVTIKQALTMPDESEITLRGQIEKRIKKDKYLFKDESGTITVEIDKDIWNGQTVGPKDTVVISGELDKDDDRSMIEVDRLVKN